MPRAFAFLVVGLVAVPTATAAPDDVVTWDLLPTHQFRTSLGTLQGVAVDASTVYVLATSNLAAYDRNGTLLAQRSTTLDGSFGAHLGDGAVVGGRIYVSTSDYPAPLTSRKAAIAVYDAATLTYITEHTPQGNLTGAGGGVGSKDGTIWWPFVHQSCSTCPRQQTIREVDPTTGAQLSSYPLVNDDGYYAYQTADWITDRLLLATNHGGHGHDHSDVYEWTGAGFLFVGRSDHAVWLATNRLRTVEFGSQGFAVEHDGDDLYVWWVGRDRNGNGSGTGDVVRLRGHVGPPVQVAGGVGA